MHHWKFTTFLPFIHSYISLLPFAPLNVTLANWELRQSWCIDCQALHRYQSVHPTCLSLVPCLTPLMGYSSFLCTSPSSLPLTVFPPLFLIFHTTHLPSPFPSLWPIPLLITIKYCTVFHSPFSPLPPLIVLYSFSLLLFLHSGFSTIYLDVAVVQRYFS